MGRVSTTGVNGPLRYIKGTKGAGAALRNCHCDWVFHESERPHSRQAHSCLYVCDQLARSKGPSRRPERHESELEPRLSHRCTRSSRSRSICDGFGIRGSVSGRLAVGGPLRQRAVGCLCLGSLDPLLPPRSCAAVSAEAARGHRAGALGAGLATRRGWRRRQGSRAPAIRGGLGAD
jgi:hypothetical protein